VESPSRKDRTRPAELLVFAGVLAIFVGLVVLLATRAPILALVALGIVFIVSLVVLAMLTLTVRPPKNADRDESDAEGPDDGH
jgi:uncharacterized membrane protein HdeD (DUF308 family)